MSFTGTGYSRDCAPIAVQPGATYVLSGFFNVVGVGQNGALYLDLSDTLWEPTVAANTALRQEQFCWQAFVVPQGVTSVRIRLVRDTNVSISVVGYIDEVALTPANMFVPPVACPHFQSQPSAQMACQSGIATFAIGVVGTGPFGYQWRFNEMPVDSIANPSAATATLVLNNVSAADMGSYDCIVSNLCGSVISDPAVLTVFAGGSGDGDASGATDGADIQDLVNVLMYGVAPSATYCAYDMNADGVVDLNDVPPFVAMLLR